MARGATLLLLAALALGGCANIHEQMLAQGYPPAYVDGFSDGCSSGRQAADAISGAFRKDVSRYLQEATYSQGWSDGFEQCRQMTESEERRQFEAWRENDRERDWQRDKNRALARALRGQ